MEKTDSNLLVTQSLGKEEILTMQGHAGAALVNQQGLWETGCVVTRG